MLKTPSYLRNEFKMRYDTSEWANCGSDSSPRILLTLESCKDGPVALNWDGLKSDLDGNLNDVFF